MDPIEMCDPAEVESFLNHVVGSRTSLKRNSKDKVDSRKGSLADTKAAKDESDSFLQTVVEPSDPSDPNNNPNNNKDKDSDQDSLGYGSHKGDPDEVEAEKPSRAHKFTGLTLAMLSCIAFSLSSLIVKYLSTYHPFSKSVWRFQGIVLPAILMMIYSRGYRKKPIFDTVIPPCGNSNWKNIMFLLIRSSVGFATIIFQFYALQYISLADQMVIGSSQPVFVTIVAYFMLGESCGIVPILISCMTIIGVVIVAKPPILTGSEVYDNDLLIGLSFSLASVIMSVMSIVMMRRMKHVHFSIITFTFGIFSSLISLICALAMGVFQLPQGENHLLLALLLAGLVFVSQTCTTLALKYEQAGPVSLTRASNIIFAFVWQYAFLNVIPDMYSILGACVIALGVILTAVRKWISTLPEDKGARKFCGFMLK